MDSNPGKQQGGEKNWELSATSMSFKAGCWPFKSSKIDQGTNKQFYLGCEIWADSFAFKKASLFLALSIQPVKQFY